MNTTRNNNTNGVNGGNGSAISTSPGRLPVENQAEAGGHLTTGDALREQHRVTRSRSKWERNDKIKEMECYFWAKSDPKTGYMSKMLRRWRDAGGGHDVDSQRLEREEQSN